MPPLIPVAILGFDAAARLGLAATLTSTARRRPGYRPVLAVDDARLVVVDADNADGLALLATLGRMADAVVIAATLARSGRSPSVDPALMLQRLDAKALAEEPPVVPSWGESRSGSEPEAQALAYLAPEPTPARPSADRLTPLQRELRRQRKFGPAPGAAPRALVVDDSEIALHFLRRKLLAHGIECDRARDSDRALDLLNQQAYRLVFLDLDLGEDSPLDGFALCHQIRQRWRHGGSDLPTIVIVSAFHDPVHQVRATLAGAQRFLGKPLDGEALAATLRNWTAMPANPSTA